MSSTRRVSARGVVIMQDSQARSCIALMHRIRPDGANTGKMLDYYVTPGGGVEEGEHIPQAAEREVWEELGLHCRAGEEIFHRLDDTHDEHVLLCSVESGAFGTGNGPEFTNAGPENGIYIPELIPLSELMRTALVPAELKTLLLERFCCDR